MRAQYRIFAPVALPGWVGNREARQRGQGAAAGRPPMGLPCGGTRAQTGTRTALAGRPRSPGLYLREPGPGQCKSAQNRDVNRSQDRRFPTCRSRLVPMSCRLPNEQSRAVMQQRGSFQKSTLGLQPGQMARQGHSLGVLEGSGAKGLAKLPFEMPTASPVALTSGGPQSPRTCKLSTILSSRGLFLRCRA